MVPKVPYQSDAQDMKDVGQAVWTGRGRPEKESNPRVTSGGNEGSPDPRRNTCTVSPSHSLFLTCRGEKCEKHKKTYL
jgi:hypothetical protein